MEKVLLKREETLLTVYAAFVNLLLMAGNAGLYLFAPENGLSGFVAAILTGLVLLLCFLRLKLRRAVVKNGRSRACRVTGIVLTALHYVLVLLMALFSLMLCIADGLFFPVFTDVLLLILNGGDILLRCLK